MHCVAVSLLFLLGKLAVTHAKMSVPVSEDVRQYMEFQEWRNKQAFQQPAQQVQPLPGVQTAPQLQQSPQQRTQRFTHAYLCVCNHLRVRFLHLELHYVQYAPAATQHVKKKLVAPVVIDEDEDDEPKAKKAKQGRPPKQAQAQPNVSLRPTVAANAYDINVNLNININLGMQPELLEFVGLFLRKPQKTVTATTANVSNDIPPLPNDATGHDPDLM